MEDNLLPDPPGKLERVRSGGLVTGGTFQQPIEIQTLQIKQKTQITVASVLIGGIVGVFGTIGITFYSLSRATPNAALESAIVEQGKQIKQLSKLAEEPKCKNTLVCVIPGGSSVQQQQPDPYSGQTYDEMTRQGQLRQQWQSYCASVNWQDRNCENVPVPEYPQTEPVRW